MTAGESVALRLHNREARTQRVPSAKEDGGHPPKCGDADLTGSPFHVRELLRLQPGLLGFVMNWREAHEDHDWCLIQVQSTGDGGAFCRDCRTGAVYLPRAAAACSLSLLPSFEGR